MVLVRPVAAQVVLSGPAVTTGIPFDGKPVALRVIATDRVGQVAATTPVIASDDADVRDLSRVRLRLPPPPGQARLRVADKWLVALRYPLFSGIVKTVRGIRDPHCGYAASAGHFGLSVRKRRRCLWRLQADSWLLRYVDTAHVWILVSGDLQLRRLRDGALMCDLPIDCDFSTVFVRLDVVGRRYSRHGVLQLHTLPGLSLLAEWSCREAAMSPAGDLVVYEDRAGKWLSRRWCWGQFTVAVPLDPAPEVPPDTDFRLTPAEELVWYDTGNVCVWKLADGGLRRLALFTPEADEDVGFLTQSSPFGLLPFYHSCRTVMLG